MHATTAALTFRDPALENKYAKWYHSGQVHAVPAQYRPARTAGPGACVLQA